MKKNIFDSQSIYPTDTRWNDWNTA